MKAETEVVIYYGPPSWFHRQIGDRKSKNLVALTYRMDEFNRQLRVVGVREGDDEPRPKLKRPKIVVGESSDFASLTDNAISNFAGFVRQMRPKKLFLNNPPVSISDQLKLVIPSVRVEQYTYPTVKTETLREFRDRYADRLVGQVDVRESLLAAMYPLTRPHRDRPVVLMLYGPSGVGKTETAQFINGLLSGDLMRKQFSMFHTDKFASYIFGGRHAEASLAKDLLDRESGVILIDEFDKANPIFHSAFYQLFDTGEFVDKNYSVSLGPALIICTSNYRSEAEIHEALGDALSSRFDGLIEFQPLSVLEVGEVIGRIVGSRVAELDEEERAHVENAQLLDLLLSNAERFANIRSLGKTIDMMISLTLVRAVLDGPTPLARQLLPEAAGTSAEAVPTPFDSGT